MEEYKVEHISLVAIKSHGKYLFQLRSSAVSSYNNLYSLPGGSLDIGESFVDAGIREVREETGIYISKEKLNPTLVLNVYDIQSKKSWVMCVFNCELNTVPTLNDNFEGECVWKTIEESRELKFDQILTNFRNDILNPQGNTIFATCNLHNWMYLDIKRS